MSFLKKLFNRKETDQDLKDSEEVNALPVEEEEDVEEESDSVTEEIDKNEILAEEDDTDMEYEIVEREIHPAKIICPDCGGITLEGLEFCDKCGGELL